MVNESTIHGTWIHAEDPAGELATEPIYEGSVLHFGADGAYRFTMGQITLEGTYEVINVAEAVTMKITLAGGEQMDSAVHPRGGGIVIVEGDGSIPGQYYAPQAN